VNRERIALALVLAVIAGIGLWIAFHTYWAEQTLPGTLQGEAARNAYYSVERVARALGIPVQRLASLRVLPPADGVLLVNDFHDSATRRALPQIEHWVESGGRLAVNWGSLWTDPALQTWSGVSTPATVTHAARDAPTAPVAVPAPAPAQAHAHAQAQADQDCIALAVQVDGTATGDRLSLCGAWLGSNIVSKRMPSWALADGAELKLLRVAVGRGSLIVIGPASLLAARTFLRGDVAEAFIAATALARGDRLTIYSPGHAEPLLAMLWRVAAPAILFSGIVLILVILRHLPRFGPPLPAPVTARRSLAEQIRANARFAWRARNMDALRRVVLHNLERTAKQQIAGYALLSQRQRAAELGRRAGLDAATLNAAMTEAANAAAERQRDAIAVLEQCRRLLLGAAPTTRPPHER
jgi:hypothetical protein